MKTNQNPLPFFGFSADKTFRVHKNAHRNWMYEKRWKNPKKACETRVYGSWGGTIYIYIYICIYIYIHMYICIYIYICISGATSKLHAQPVSRVHAPSVSKVQNVGDLRRAECSCTLKPNRKPKTLSPKPQNPKNPLRPVPPKRASGSTLDPKP